MNMPQLPTLDLSYPLDIDTDDIRRVVKGALIAHGYPEHNIALLYNEDAEVLARAFPQYDLLEFGQSKCGKRITWVSLNLTESNLDCSGIVRATKRAIAIANPLEWS